MKYKDYLHKLPLLLIVFLLVLHASAQKKQFMYLQSEDKQPFYVMLNNKNYSSSMSGYLVIPKLKPGRYFFTAGFPKDIYPEQKFSCVIEEGKDVGYALKRFGDKGWGLFDYVSFNIIMANPSGWEKDKAVYDTIKLSNDDAFNVQPAKQQPATKPVETETNAATSHTATPVVADTKPATAAVVNTVSPPPVKNEPAATSINTDRTEMVAVAQAAQPTITSRYQVVKTYDRNSNQGVDQVYVDYMPNKNDTITVFIPYNNYSKAAASETAATDTSSKQYTAGSASQYNRSCVNLATETDFARSRKLMSYETTDDKMTAAAKKSFKDKCFTTEQVKKLGLLYLSEQSRCKFFIMAKPFVYDVFNYPSLETEFTISSAMDQFRKSTN